MVVSNQNRRKSCQEIACLDSGGCTYHGQVFEPGVVKKLFKYSFLIIKMQDDTHIVFQHPHDYLHAQSVVLCVGVDFGLTG